MSENTQLEMWIGDSAPYLLTVTNKAGSPFDLTGWTITMSARKKKTDVTPVFQIVSPTDITIRAPNTQGLADIVIPTSATSTLTQTTTMFFDVQITKGALRHTVDSGTLLAKYDITRP